MLAQDGWKYFTIKNLNELFSIMLERHGTQDIVEEVFDEHVNSERIETPILNQSQELNSPFMMDAVEKPQLVEVQERRESQLESPKKQDLP